MSHLNDLMKKKYRAQLEGSAAWAADPEGRGERLTDYVKEKKEEKPELFKKVSAAIKRARSNR